MNTVIQRGDTPAAVRMIRRGLLAGLVAGCDSAPVSEPDVCLAQGIICTSVGTGRLGFNGDGLPAADTNLYWPQAVRFDREGRLVVADLNNFRVRRVETDGTVMTILGNGFHLASSEGLRATESPVDFPADVRFLPDGSYYVVAIHENRVLWVDTEAVVHVVIGDGNEGYTGDGAPARDAQLSGPSGMALADDGTLYVADTLNHAIRVVTPDGMINTLAGRGLPGFAGDGGPASGALLNNPTALTLDGDTLYVADSFNHAVRAIDLPTTTIRTVAGSGARGYSGDDGSALAATFYSPEGVAVAADGAIWIADSGNHVIRIVATDGTVSTVAGTSEPAYSGDGAPCTDATFQYPADVSFDDYGNLYISDMANGAVRVIHGASAW